MKPVSMSLGNATYYSKKDFVDTVIKTKKHYVGKLRCDANLKYLYDGKPIGKAGRPNQ